MSPASRPAKVGIDAVGRTRKYETYRKQLLGCDCVGCRCGSLPFLVTGRGGANPAGESGEAPERGIGLSGCRQSGLLCHRRRGGQCERLEEQRRGAALVEAHPAAAPADWKRPAL